MLKRKGMTIIVVLLLAVTSAGCRCSKEEPAPEKHWTTLNALEKMKSSELYQEIQRICKDTPDKKSEVLLEECSYAWGGYRAILMIEDKGGVAVYGAEDESLKKGAVPEKEYRDFMEKLKELGAWDLESSVREGLDDGPTYFLSISEGEKTKKALAYSPFHVKGDVKAVKFREIARLIQDFSKRFYIKKSPIKSAGSKRRQG